MFGIGLPELIILLILFLGIGAVILFIVSMSGQDKKSRYCIQCATQNPVNARFCFKCGTLLQDVSAVGQKADVLYFAGFWRRFLAFLIDTVILMFGGFIIGAIFGAFIGAFLGAMGRDIETIQALAGGVGNILGLVINWLYYTLFESSPKQATLGKMALGIMVTDLNGTRISFGRANGRYWSKIISSIILFIGFIMAGFTKRKQALHDMIASTLVLKK